ncbi:hypothetical protein B0T21DRAFT_409251 [Apiosordaria backusii]|uniref:Uncharacterized protein n=1 Tax=Apiosordaria backusii TaxID=314023 RepID=A0AA40K1J4_9PEZI|nr:hypothetical protein B0T21DRAFT_409251 [Apiosordaria backusii]
MRQQSTPVLVPRSTVWGSSLKLGAHCAISLQSSPEHQLINSIATFTTITSTPTATTPKDRVSLGYQTPTTSVSNLHLTVFITTTTTCPDPKTLTYTANHPPKNKRRKPPTSRARWHSPPSSAPSSPVPPPPHQQPNQQAAPPLQIQNRRPLQISQNQTQEPPKDHHHDEKLTLKSPTTTSEETAELARSRQRLESKSRLYAAMQRGDYLGKEYGLVDFDRKWAEQNPNSAQDEDLSSSSDSEPEEEATIEYTDEYGRTRLLTPSQKAALDRAAASKVDLEKMAGRPVAVPSDLIFGDAVQTEAFNTTEQMEELARKRDRSATPPPETHYDANWEIRTKGVGFYKFSQGGEERRKEMEGLERERERTEKEREEREREKQKRKEELERRRREIEARRREMGEKKAERLASRFLEGLEGEVFGGGGDGGGKTEQKDEGRKDEEGKEEA